MVLNGKSDPRDSSHPANRRAQQVKMHTLTDFQLYVQNMGSSNINHGNPEPLVMFVDGATSDSFGALCATPFQWTRFAQGVSISMSRLLTYNFS